MSTHLPSLTVVIAAWDAPYVDWLPRAVASVRAQDEDVPIVLVDNASAVALPAIEGTTVVEATHRLSVGEARNLGLERVETECVLLLDADDELAEGALDSLREGIAADPAVAVYALTVLEAATGRRHRMPRRFASALARAPRVFALATALWSLYPIQGNAIMRTQWIRDACGYPDRDWGDDWVVAVSQAFRGRVVIDPRPGRVYHAHPGSLRLGSGGPSRLLAAAGAVRERLRTDPAVPGWARAALPLIAAAQTLLILVVRPAYQLLRAPFSAALGLGRRDGGRE